MRKMASTKNRKGPIRFHVHTLHRHRSVQPLLPSRVISRRVVPLLNLPHLRPHIHLSPSPHILSPSQGLQVVHQAIARDIHQVHQLGDALVRGGLGLARRNPQGGERAASFQRACGINWDGDPIIE